MTTHLTKDNKNSRKKTYQNFSKFRRNRVSYAAIIFLALLITYWFFFNPKQAPSVPKSVVSKGESIVTPSTRYIPKPAKYYGPLSPISDKIFVMLKSGADLAHKRLPIHMMTTLRRYPHHAVYSDEAVRIGEFQVENIFEKLPQKLFSAPEFEEYNLRQESIKNNFNWAATDVHLGDDFGWRVDKYKNIPMLVESYKKAPPQIEWFLMIDDDTYVLQHSLERMARELDPLNVHYYLGSWARIEDSMTKHTKGQDPGSVFAHGGSGILMSRSLVEYVVEKLLADPELMEFFYSAPIESCCGDLALGFLIKELTGEKTTINQAPRHITYPDPWLGENFGTTRVYTDDMCGHIASFHHMSPESIQKMYDWESDLVDRKGDLSMGILYADFYNDFVLPYLTEEKEMWNNHAAKKRYLMGSGEETFDGVTVTPSESKEQCKKACEAWKNCFMWSYLYDDHTCYLDSERFQLGESTRTKDRKTISKRVSGWSIDRIREYRSKSKCDFLQKVDGKFTDTPEQQEGWYFRELENSINQP